EIGLSLESATLENLGSAKRVTISKENTIIVDGAGVEQDIQARISNTTTFGGQELDREIRVKTHNKRSLDDLAQAVM
ncbi:hypothetical protein Q6272_33575, partial [Klebsiella pneumoniae]|uniref:hypothetical protein n=1 Tax=Klebsiella pneumoniae TaxID=573 RepID=UPI00272FE3B8